MTRTTWETRRCYSSVGRQAGQTQRSGKASSSRDLSPHFLWALGWSQSESNLVLSAISCAKKKNPPSLLNFLPTKVCVHFILLPLNWTFLKLNSKSDGLLICKALNCTLTKLSYVTRLLASSPAQIVQVMPSEPHKVQGVLFLVKLKKVSVYLVHGR